MEIRLLDENTIDKIAAGEVVDRPASVVKELAENAMDSGADAITVEIRDGGVSLIRVTDNGSGIAADQVPNAFLRHATSKIRSAEDLLQLSSLGFRGEALSSICAVAQVEMITKTTQALTGTRYSIAGGVEKEREEIGAPQGTTVLVRNLFYNVPARKKFLKSLPTEGGQISDLMERLALSHPAVSFKYVQNGQTRFHTSGNGSLQEIIYRIYGRDVAGELVWVEKEEEGRRLSGFLGTPVVGRANRNFEQYFINGRFIKNPVIARAAEEAYKPYLMQHKYPFFVLHIALEPDRMDVNVHPSKMEVRFHEPEKIADFIYGAIHDTLADREMLKKADITVRTEKKQSKEEPYVPEPFETEARKQRQEAQKQPGPAQVREEPVYSRLFGSPQQVGTVEGADLHHNIIKKDAHVLVERPMQMNFFEEKLLSGELLQEYRIIGQVFDTYWIVSFRDRLFFIDQHAAHEKVKYERLCRQIRENRPVSQQLAPPVIVTFSGREESVYREYASCFENMGFVIEHFGGSEYAVRGVPADLFGQSAKALLESVLDELADGPVRGEPEVIAAKLASMSCKAAVKGNQPMSEEEARALIRELMTLENPYHCPHGRPTIIIMSKSELEKRFSRIL